MTTRVCTFCKIEKDISNFTKRGGGRTDTQARCKQCRASVEGAKRKDDQLKIKYGIDLLTFQRMVLDQNGLCYICKEEKALHVDHCHKTGDVRKLLCTTCNTGLGCFYDNQDLLQRAIGYLEEVKKKEPNVPEVRK